MNDSSSRYGTVTRVLHWSMALFILLQFLKFGDRINDGEHWIGQTLVPTHISLGVLLMTLIVLRGLWVLRQRARRPVHEGPMALLVKVLLHVGCHHWIKPSHARDHFTCSKDIPGGARHRPC